MRKNFPFSSTRQAERVQRQGLHNVSVPVNGKHNTVLQAISARARQNTGATQAVA